MMSTVTTSGKCSTSGYYFSFSSGHIFVHLGKFQSAAIGRKKIKINWTWTKVKQNSRTFTNIISKTLDDQVGGEF